MKLNKDKILHAVANKVLSFASEKYRLSLRTTIELGREAVKDEEIFTVLVDRIKARQ